MSETNSNRLGMGDKFLIETGNDIVTKMRELREAQKDASKSKYAQEQIAWEILSLTRRLNDTTIDEMESRAKNELAAKEYAPTGELKDTLDAYVKDICTLRNTMTLARQARETSSKEAMYKIFATQEQMNAMVKSAPDGGCITVTPLREIQVLKTEMKLRKPEWQDETKAKGSVPENVYDHRKAFKRFKTKIEALQKALEAKKTDKKISELNSALEDYNNSPDALTTVVLQTLLINRGQKISKDGKFGDKTMKALEDIVGIKREEEKTDGVSFKKERTGKGGQDTTEKKSGVDADKKGIGRGGYKKSDKVGTLSNNIDISKNSPASLIFRDGAYYLTGPKGRPTRVELQSIAQAINLPKNAPANLQKSVAIVQDFALVLDAYLLAHPKEKQKYNTAIESVKTLFTENSVSLGKNVIDVTSITKELFSNSRVSFGDTDLRAINEAFRKGDSQARHFAVLQFIRERLDQSDIVAKSIMSHNENELGIDDTQIMEGNISAIGLNASQKQKVEKVIDEAKVEAAKNWKDHKAEYIESFQKQNPSVKVDEQKAEEWNKRLTILAMAKHEIFYQKLYNVNQTDPELNMLQNILGASTIRMSDRVVDITGEVASMLAIEAIAIAVGTVTAGVGTAAINAVALGRNAYRGVRALEAYETASKTRKVLTTAGRILGSGTGFEAGAATVRSYHENRDLTSMHSKEGYAQSIAMMGVLKGVGALIECGAFGKGIQFKEGAGFRKNVLPFTGQVILDGSAIFGTTGVIGQMMVDGRDNWTPEQLAQAMLMATLFKGAGRVKIGKTKEGDPIAEPVNEPESYLTPEFFRGVREFVGKPHREFLVSIKNVLKKGEYPHFPGEDGMVWSIRKLGSGPNGQEPITIGKLGSTQEEIIMPKRLKEIININIRKFAEWENTQGKTKTTEAESTVKESENVPPEILTNNSPFIEILQGKTKILKKTGDTLEIDGNTIEQTNKGYSLTREGKVTEFDSMSDLHVGLTNIYNTPGKRIPFLNKIGTKEMSARLKRLDGKEINGTNLRIRLKNEEVIFQKKINGGWENTKIEEISEAHAIKILESLYETKGLNKIQNLFTREGNPEELVSKEEKKSFIIKHGEAAWKSVTEKFKGESKALGSTIFGSAKNILSFTTGIGRSHTSWGGALIATGIGQSLDIYSKGWDEYKSEIVGKGGMEAMGELLLTRYTGVIRSTLFLIGYKAVSKD